MYFLGVTANLFQIISFTFVGCYPRTNNKGRENHLNKIKIIKGVNDDELVFNSSGLVLEVNQREEGTFTKL